MTNDSELGKYTPRTPIEGIVEIVRSPIGSIQIWAYINPYDSEDLYDIF